MDRAKLGQTITRLIEDRGARSLGERTEIYAAARNSLRKATNNEPAIIADLDEVIDEIEASRIEGGKIKEEGGARRGGATRLLPVALAGLVVGGAAAVAVMVFGLRFQPYSPVAATLMRQYKATAPLVPAAVEYLHKVADAVVAMQKSDPAALEAKAAKYVPLSALDRTLANKLPPSMPVGSGILVKANKEDYKILFGWTLCGAARFVKPEMVDPVRTRADVLGCPYFGLWSPGAAKW